MRKKNTFDDGSRAGCNFWAEELVSWHLESPDWRKDMGDQETVVVPGIWSTSQKTPTWILRSQFALRAPRCQKAGKRICWSKMQKANFEETVQDFFSQAHCVRKKSWSLLSVEKSKGKCLAVVTCCSSCTTSCARKQIFLAYISPLDGTVVPNSSWCKAWILKSMVEWRPKKELICVSFHWIWGLYITMRSLHDSFLQVSFANCCHRLMFPANPNP